MQPNRTMEYVNRFNSENDGLTKMVLNIDKRNGFVGFGRRRGQLH